MAPRVDRDASGRVERDWLSAVTGAGIDLLLDAIAERLQTTSVRQRLLLGPEDGALRAWLFRHATVECDRPTDLGGWDMAVSMPYARWQRLHSGRDPISRRLCALTGPTQPAAVSPEHAPAAVR
jgi:GTP-binding protein HflX